MERAWGRGAEVLLLVERGGGVAGLVDAVRDWPEPGAVAVGVFLLAPWARGRGLGRAVAETLLARGASRVTGHGSRVTVPAGWTAGECFLEGLGFALEAPGGVAAGVLSHTARRAGATPPVPATPVPGRRVRR
ncbi:GNAT family N-acetyltransferase [Streptomyces bauhiniae]|uniref:GNAT family N-acetyltransferase n=1 Tax=Streptomyces bauhiniae TaxID=2340725 RepID=UPI0033228DB1